MQAGTILHKLLQQGNRSSSQWWSMLGLLTGLLLLGVSILAYLNFNQLQRQQLSDNNLADYLVISKQVQDSLLTQKAAFKFTGSDIAQIKTQPFIEDVGEIRSCNQPVYLTVAGLLETFIFFESAPDAFLGEMGPSWHWTPDSSYIPVLLSNDLLQLYNFGFAPSQGLPQISEKTLNSFPLQLTVGQQKYQARIIGVSDRITSVLVPWTFTEHINQEGAFSFDPQPSRLILKVKNTSDPALLRFLEQAHYNTNQNPLQSGKLNLLIKGAVIGMNAFGLLVLLLSFLVLSMYARLSISRKQGEIVLLNELGYSPRSIRSLFFRDYRNKIIVCAIVAIAMASIVQYLLMAKVGQWMQISLTAMPAAIACSAIAGIALLMLALQHRSIKGQIR
jgi:hypothetical protein